VQKKKKKKKNPTFFFFFKKKFIFFWGFVFFFFLFFFEFFFFFIFLNLKKKKKKKTNLSLTIPCRQEFIFLGIVYTLHPWIDMKYISIMVWWASCLGLHLTILAKQVCNFTFYFNKLLPFM